jgi:hypothetical protein
MAVSNDEGEALETDARVTQESHHEAMVIITGRARKITTFDIVPFF